MPIRFRCVYCDKLLGIARRKAGAVVNCPQCGQPLIVPTPEPEPEKTAAATPSAPASVPVSAPGRLFERDDFDVILQDDLTVPAKNQFEAAPKRNKAQRAPAPAPPPAPAPLPPRPFPVEQGLPSPFEPPPLLPRPARPRPKGMVLTTGRLVAAIVVVLVLLLVAFGSGVIVGRMLLPGTNA